jgi:hypothetical protein
MRIDSFLNNLKNTDDVINVCKSEKEYLDFNYGSLPTRKRSYSDYRKAISTHDFEQEIKDDCLKVFRLSSKEYVEYKDAYKKTVVKSQDNLRSIYNYEKYIERAVSLLDYRSYPEQLLGFAALTGRRVAEIGCTANFKIASSNELIFLGQLKTKCLEAKSYPIPVLTHSFTLVQKFAEFRERYTKYLGSPERFHNNNSKYINSFVKKHFNEFVEGDITPKDLRAIYARVTCHLYKPPKQTAQRYIALILGHSENDLETCNSYFDFELEL